MSIINQKTACAQFLVATFKWGKKSKCVKKDMNQVFMPKSNNTL